MREKWPPLDPGTRVRTTGKKTPDSEWTPEALASRKWGVSGTIVMHHDSHGLCYDVRHDDGTEGCYDPLEFDVIPKKTGYWIYPGERRPVIVRAETEEEAREKVRKSPEYDGFGPSVYRVEAFAVLCEHGQAP